jgi:hypothetical protein
MCFVRGTTWILKTEYVLSLKAVSWLRTIVGGLSRRTYVSLPGQTMSDSWRTGGRPFPEYLVLPYQDHSKSAPYMSSSTLCFYRNNRTGENWETYQKKKHTALLRNSGNTGYKMTLAFFVLKILMLPVYTLTVYIHIFISFNLLNFGYV